jgi:hypothetical protein
MTRFPPRFSTGYSSPIYNLQQSRALKPCHLNLYICANFLCFLWTYQTTPKDMKFTVYSCQYV